MQIFPGDDFPLKKIEGWLEELIFNGLIKTYHIDDKRYLLITGWHHQKIDKPSNKYPIPGIFDDHSTNTPLPLGDPSPPEGKVKEGKGKEGNTLCVFSDAFLSFWEVYPNHTAKKSAFKEWEKAKDKPPLETILSAIKNQKRAKQDRKDAGQFVSEWPDPERWIKKARWDDELEAETGGKPWYEQNSTTSLVP
jgi:hypothetical protein